MSAAKMRRIIIQGNTYLSLVLKELKAWQVDPKLYQVEDGRTAILTKNNNVIDVVTETLRPHLYKIETVENAKTN